MATNKATLRKAAESPDLTGVLDLSADGRQSLDDDRELLFTGPDGTRYTIPAQCPPGVSLEYLRLTGIAGYQALVADDTLTATELGRIISVVIPKVISGFTLPKV